MSARRGSDMTLLRSAGKKDGSSLFNVGEAMIRLHLIPYLLCASMSLWLDSVTAGIIITSISDKTTEAQRHRDRRTSNRAIGFLCIFILNCFV